MVSLSTRSRYGTRFLMALARHSSKTPMQIADVAMDQWISVKYLEQIALVLTNVPELRGARLDGCGRSCPRLFLKSCVFGP
ncbi:MAG: Rrf2 family transcriptional regulator [Desulfosoma sp.]|uniref:Rrf2 family transcriptional regulator n=1 Tax=Desulfosoma sp. TaxID=2603217 RepID=UPI004049BB09